jgi:hypothetical protein
MKVIDNFIDNNTLDNIEHFLLGKEMMWYYVKQSVVGYDDSRYTDSSVLRNGFVLDSVIHSNKVEILRPILNRICDEVGEMINLVSASVNLLLPNQELLGKHSIPHVDAGFDNFDFDVYNTYTGIFYVNDSDGDTVLFKEQGSSEKRAETLTELTRVTPKKNRFFYWDSRHYHAAPCCGTSERLVINFNFYVKK